MITATGYSKVQSLQPEGIVITFGKEMINEHGGLLAFIREFEACMNDEGNYWLHKCRAKPGLDDRLLLVYIIICNRLRYRCY